MVFERYQVVKDFPGHNIGDVIEVADDSRPKHGVLWNIYNSNGDIIDVDVFPKFELGSEFFKRMDNNVLHSEMVGDQQLIIEKDGNAYAICIVGSEGGEWIQLCSAPSREFAIKFIREYNIIFKKYDVNH